MTMWQSKIFTCPLTQCLWLCRVGTYREDPPSIRSPDLLITWSYKVMWTIQAAVSLLPRGTWPQNRAKWWLTIRNVNLSSQTTLWTRSRVRSRDQLKAFYLHRVVTYNKELPFINSRPFITCSSLFFLTRFLGLKRKCLSHHQLLVLLFLLLFNLSRS